MAEIFKEPFVNPYVDEEANEARFSTFVSMDEAHERWKSGAWKPGETNFELDPSMFEDSRGLKLDADGKSTEQAHENRFAFDLKKDIIDADQASSRLDDNAYTNNYRPQGSIGSGISNLAIRKMKYNALADIKEELPEDLSYLYGSDSARRVEKKEVRLRSYDRLKTPVAQRRAEIERMLPEEAGESPESIMADIRKRRDIEDAKSGVDREASRRAYRRGIYESYVAPGSVDDFYDSDDLYDIENVTERGSWRSEIPVQDGLVPDSKSQPVFGRFSRSWSQIDSPVPSRVEMLRHTVNTIYDDEPSARDQKENGRFRANGGRREYYVSDMDFDPNDRYRRMERQRRRVSASKNVLSDRIMSGQFNNPYVQTSNERLRHIIGHDMRGPGHVAEPEGLTDPALMYEWNMGYSRVNTQDNQYADWLRQQSSLAEQAEQSRYRGSHRPGRPGAYMQREKPYGEARRYPRGDRREREVRRRDIQEQMRRATEQGIADGREIIRLQQKAKREAEQEKTRRREEERRRLYEQQRRAYEQQMKAYEKQQAAYRKQQEQMMKQQQAAYGAQPGQSGAYRPAYAAQGNAQTGGVRTPQYGPMGYYTPKPQTDASRSKKNGR